MAPIEMMQIYSGLLGEDVLANTVFVTTQQPGVNDLEPLPALGQGPRIMRFSGTRESAHEILAAIPYISHARRTPLRIQKELVDQNLGLQETLAGQLVVESIRETITFYKHTVQGLQKRLNELGDESVAKQEDLVKEIELYNALLANTKKAQKALTSNLWRKFVQGILKMIYFKFSVL